MLKRLQSLVNQVFATDSYTASRLPRGPNLAPLAVSASGEDFTGPQERHGALWAAVHLIASAIAACPKYVAQVNLDNPHSEGDYVSGHYLNRPMGVLRRPSHFLSRYTFYEKMAARILTHGNSYVHVSRDNLGRPSVLTLATRSSVERLSGPGRARARYTLDTYGEGGQDTIQLIELGSRNVIRMHGNGYKPASAESPSPIAYALQKTMGIAYAAQEYQKRIFKGGVLTRGFITTPGDMTRSDKADERFLQYLQDYVGASKASNFLQLPPGFDFKAVNFPAVDLQVIELLRWTSADIARLYHIPPVLLGVKGDSTAGAGAENVGNYFVNYALRPVVEIIETGFTDTLLTMQDRQAGLVVRLDVSAMASGTASQKTQLVERLVNSGIATPNEARMKLGLPPMEGGDELGKQMGGTPAANQPDVPMRPVGEPEE